MSVPSPPKQVTELKPLDWGITRTGASLGELLVGRSMNKILGDSPEYFSSETNVDIFEVNAGVGSLRSGLKDADYLGALESDAKRVGHEPHMRIIFLDEVQGHPQRLPITASLLRHTMDTYNITPRVVGFLNRQAMPGRVVHHDENAEVLKQELWYSSVIRSSIKTDTTRDHPSLRKIDRMMALIWSDYNVQTHKNTLMIWRCPAAVKQAFLSTFLGANGRELVVHPMLVHAFLAEQIVNLTFDFIGMFSESIYEWEFKGQSVPSAEDYTERSQAFLALSRQIRQVATDYDVLQESVLQLQKAYIWLQEIISTDAVQASSSLNSNAVLLDIFQRFPKEVKLIRTHSDLYLQRTKIDVNECFALTTQLDAKLNLSMATESTQMARASNQDNKALRIIQVLSIIFLPASLVANVLGMSFFSTTPGDAGESIFTISENWWIYPAISFPLTVAIMFLVFGYRWWGRLQEKKNQRALQDLELGIDEKKDE